MNWIFNRIIFGLDSTFEWILWILSKHIKQDYSGPTCTIWYKLAYLTPSTQGWWWPCLYLKVDFSFDPCFCLLPALTRTPRQNHDCPVSPPSPPSNPLSDHRSHFHLTSTFEKSQVCLALVLSNSHKTSWSQAKCYYSILIITTITKTRMVHQEPQWSVAIGQDYQSWCIAECDVPVPGIPGTGNFSLFWWYRNRYRKKLVP